MRHVSPPAALPLRGVANLFETPEQDFAVFGNALANAGLRLTYGNEPSFAQDPNPPTAVKLELIECWAGELGRVLVEKSGYNAMQGYLAGTSLRRVQAQIDIDGRVQATSSGAFVPPLAERDATQIRLRSGRVSRPKRERPASLLVDAPSTKKASEPKRAKQDAWRESAESRMSSTMPPSSPVYDESEDEPFEEGPDSPSETPTIEDAQVSANDESFLLPLLTPLVQPNCWLNTRLPCILVSPTPPSPFEKAVLPKTLSSSLPGLQLRTHLPLMMRG
ncbi:hypothetical protein KEM55_001988 [Ascosphaera atra]|nr:hypothetical protein KEM55_001988 [Ascosphaera atra]